MTLVRSERRDGIAIVTLDRPRANAFDPGLVSELRSALSQSADTRGVVLASSQRIFSAGWDLPIVASYDRRRMSAFVDGYTSLVREVFAFRAPVVAALSGHAIAGGLILAAAADERIAAEGAALFGLSEVNLGVPLPRPLYELFRHLLGPREAERLAASAENLPTTRAASMGLVDRVVPAEKLLDEAVARAQVLGAPRAAATGEVKSWARADALARFDRARQDDPFLDHWFSTEARERIESFAAKFKKN